jgi:hypothetical protein
MNLFPSRGVSFACVSLFLILACMAPRIAAQGQKLDVQGAPLVFEPNRGQVPGTYQFLARRSGMESLYLADGMDIFVPQSKSAMARLRMRWVEANPKTVVEGEERLPGRSNYLWGSDESRWLRGIPQFGRIRYKKIYSGIDLLFHGSGYQLENDFLVEAGADPSQIALHFDRPARVAASGELEVDLGESKIYFRRPIAYQESGTNREEVSAKFILAAEGEVKFEVGEYDRHRELVIDPVFGFSTYLGGTGNDQITAVTADKNGNIYVTGHTISAAFPLVNPEQSSCPGCSGLKPNAFVSKLDPTGHTLLYSTYIGGSNGDFGAAIVLDSKGNILVAGVSGSSDFPHAGAVPAVTCQINASCYFVASLKADGSALNYSGLVGGSQGPGTPGNNGALAVDPAGNAYLTGITGDPNFQLTPGTLGPPPTSFFFPLMFVLKVDPTGKLVYSTTIPGTAPQDSTKPNNNNFLASGIAVNSNGEVTTAGTAGPGLPVTSGVLQSTFPNAANDGAGFLMQLNSTATAVNYATYIPGTDGVGGFVVDSQGNSYVTGNTSETNLPVSANAYQKTLIPGINCTCNAGYILKLDGQGKSVLAATYLSGTPLIGNEGTSFTGLALDSKSNVLVGGVTASPDFPLKNPFVSILPFSSLVLAQTTPDLSTLLFGSFLSGPDLLGGSQFGGVAVDPQDKAIVVGETNSTSFPTTPNSFEPTGTQQNPFPDLFISKLDLAIPAPSVCLSSTFIDFGSLLPNTSTSQALTVTNCGNAPLQLSAVRSSVATVTAAQSCGSVAPSGSCSVQLTFTPTDVTTTAGTLTLTDNAAVGQQTMPFTGKGGLPNVSIPGTFATSDLLVGTHGEGAISFLNQGGGNWIVSQVTATGDFTVDNHCTAPLPPFFPFPISGGPPFCFIGVIFAPTQVGQRTGTLTITDNAMGSPHVVALSGNGLTAYATPSISAIGATPNDAKQPTLNIQGTNFFPASQVLVGGTPRETLYGDQQSLSAVLTAADLAQIGEVGVTVVNPAPGGGISNVYTGTIYSVMRNLAIQHSVFDPKSGLLYGTVAASAAANANQVVVVDPAAGKVMHAWSVGNGPNQITISSDGTLLYVGLDGDKKVAQVSLPSGTVNFAVGLGTDPTSQTALIAEALAVLPSQPHAWVVTPCTIQGSPCERGVAVFDDAMERPTSVPPSPFPTVQLDEMLFLGNDATKLYGASLGLSPPMFYQLAINNAGITPAQDFSDVSSPSLSGGSLDTDGTSIYVSNGRVVDPATLTIKSTFTGIPGAPFATTTTGATSSELIVTQTPGMKVDAAVSRIYFAGQAPIGLNGNFLSNDVFAIDAFDLVKQQLQGTILMPELTGSPQMFRWGSNGLGLAGLNGVFLLRTSLTSGTTPAPQFFVTGLSPARVQADSGDLALTISGSGFAAGDAVTVNGTAVNATVSSGSQIIATIPAALLTTPGDIPILITDTAKHVGNLELVVTPAPSPVAALSATALTFAAQIVNTASASQSVTITNNGTMALLVSGVSVSGDFSESNNCISVVAGTSCAIAVVFKPTAGGTRSGVLTINDNDASKSQTVTLSGVGSDIQIGGAGSAGTSATVTAGQPASYSLSVAPAGGFTGLVTFSCSNLPQNAACSINPPSVNLTTGSVSVAVTISTSQQQAALAGHGDERIMGGGSWLALLVLLPLYGLRNGVRGSKALGWVFVLVILLGGAMGAGCGGGSSGGGSPTPTPPVTTSVTPQGTYTVSFTATSASAGVSKTIPLTLVVQ